MSVRKMKNVCLLGLVALLDVREPAFAQAAAGTYSIGSVPVEVMLRSPSVPTAGSTSLSPDGKRFAYTRCDSAKNAAAHPQDPQGPHRYFTTKGVPVQWVGCVIWIANTDASEQLQVTSDNSNSWSPSWSADGTRLAFYSDRDGLARLWLWTVREAKLKRLTSESVHPDTWQRPFWTPDGKYLLIPLIPSGVDFETAITPPSEPIRQETQPLWKYAGAAVHIFSANRPDAKIKASQSQSAASVGPPVIARPQRPWLSELAYVNTNSGRAKRIGIASKNDWYEISPDGAHVAVARKTATLAGEYHEQFTAEVISLDGARTELTSSLEGVAPVGSWSPDGRRIAVAVTSVDSKKSSDSTTLYLLDAAGGAPKIVPLSEAGYFGHGPPAWDAESRYVYLLGSKRAGENTLALRNLIARVQASDGVRTLYPSDPYSARNAGFLRRGAMSRWDSFGKNRLVYAAINQDTKDSALVGFDLLSGQVAPLWVGAKRFAGPFADVLGTEDVQMSADGHTLVAYLDSSDRPPDFYTLTDSLAQERQITTVDPQLSKYTYGRTELVKWNSTEGAPLEGVLVLPAHYVQSQKYPTVLFVYPDDDFSDLLNGFNVAGLEQMLATRGYAVLLASTIVRPEGGLMQSIAHSVVPAAQKLIEMGIADPDRLGLMGGSFGGYATAAVVTQTALFRAAVVMCGDADLLSSYGQLHDDGATDQGWLASGQYKLHATLWEHPERYIENSPIFYLDKVTTPVLILHGAHDDRVLINQGRELYADLNQLGKEVMLRQYDLEGHALGAAKFADRADMIYSQIEWFDRYLKRIIPQGDVESSGHEVAGN